MYARGIYVANIKRTLDQRGFCFALPYTILFRTLLWLFSINTKLPLRVNGLSQKLGLNCTSHPLVIGE